MEQLKVGIVIFQNALETESGRVPNKLVAISSKGRVYS